MSKQAFSNGLKWAALASAVTALDQATKIWVEHAFALGESAQLIPRLFNLTYVQNRGIAFGMLSQHNQSQWIGGFIVVALLTIAFFTRPYWKSASEAEVIGCSLILGGAIGNLIDRFRLGYVIDFFDFHIGKYHWPAFNVADSAICLGVGSLILFSLKKQQVV